ncbi:MAG: SIMPL domain-containing protein [Pseudomonadota bacterium]
MKNLILSSIMITAFIFMSSPMGTSEAEARNHGRKAAISVTGTGTVETTPDMAVISVGVVREAKTAREALSANNEAMAKVLAAMKEQGIADKDLQTSNFNISPNLVYPKRTSTGEQPAPRIVGYTVSNNLTIRIRELAKVGEILDETVSLGVNQGGGIQFLNAETKPFLKEARVKDVEDAKEKAQTLAEASGVTLGKILSINEGGSVNRPRPVAYARSATVAEAAAVPVAAGENSYSVTVQIRWAISEAE